MKFVINVKRDATYEAWTGMLRRKGVSACHEDVDRMFDGLENRLRAKFEISNVRPRYKDYHTFIWLDGSYRAREIIRGWNPCLVRDTSSAIRDRFQDEGPLVKWYTIFITAL